MEKVVVHFNSGNILKGLVAAAHVRDGHLAVVPDREPSELALLIPVDRVKGIFFVKDFDGRPRRKERRRFPAHAYASARRTVLRFNDGEILYGYSRLSDYPTEAFWVVPSDDGCNNERILIHPDSIRDMKIRLGADRHSDPEIPSPVKTQAPITL